MLYTSPHEHPTPLFVANPMLCTSPHDRLRTPPLRFLVPIAGNTQADDTPSIWLGEMRDLGYLGHIPNCSEVPEPPPPSYPWEPPQTRPPNSPPPPLLTPKSFRTRLGYRIRTGRPPRCCHSSSASRDAFAAWGVLLLEEGTIFHLL